MIDRNATGRFSERAAAYSVHRPAYPPEVFDALFEGLGDCRSLVVADVGAGTGISTEPLADRVERVFAVEPNAAMRSRARPLPNVTWIDGTGEETRLADKSVDVAAAFQAYHWFHAERAFAEFRRIARRRAALVQYERDERQAFSRAYADTIRPFMIDDTEALRILTLERFSALAGNGLRRSVVPSIQVLTLEGVLGRIDSSSYLPKEGSQALLLRERARELFMKHESGGAVEMAMAVHVLTAVVA